jgi:HD-GYP domain-containing protein (c-di-GMP phosphodiesterase class II)
MENKEIWYQQDSATVTLAEGLRGRYRVRALPNSCETAARKQTGSDACLRAVRAVMLADVAQDEWPSQISRQLDIAVIGILPITKADTPACNLSSAGRRYFALLPPTVSYDLLCQIIEMAFVNIDLADRERSTREELKRAQEDMEELNRIGVALSAQNPPGSLLQMILQKARTITGADAGSLYLVDETPEGGRQLTFKVTQNDSRDFPFRELVLPLSDTSMAGYVAIHGEPLRVADAYESIGTNPAIPYRFNPEYDRATGYRTQSILTLPMSNAKAKTVGVLQLINCKRDRKLPMEMTEVQPFPDRAVRLALSLASQAAVAYENSQLHQDIEALFEGFVHAAVTAIEQRDPTTSGHSLRVANMTCKLAQIIDAAETGRYAEARFSPVQIKELRYAALLHDFGKVAVREEVLVKAKKLYPSNLTLLQQRFENARKSIEVDHLDRKLRAMLTRTVFEAPDNFGNLEEEFHRKQVEIDKDFGFILEVNEPTVLPEGKFDRLIEIAGKTYIDSVGHPHNLLTPEEVRALSIPRGSLDTDERQQIESHVMHSFNFLMQIPWTSELKDIPAIARAHHEKLNGTGYPFQLRAEEIPIQARMMTICDIFDALSASDRPYKKAVPVDRALDMLAMSVREHELDADLFGMFIEGRIFNYA